MSTPAAIAGTTEEMRDSIAAQAKAVGPSFFHLGYSATNKQQPVILQDGRFFE